MLTNEQKQFFETNGYVLVKGLITPAEAALYRAECHALATRLADLRGIEDPTWGSAGTRGITQLRHCHDVQFQSGKLAQLMLDDRITSCAADCIGSPNVQLHHSKMFIKPAEKGSPFPMHQDAPYFPHDNHSMIGSGINTSDEARTTLLIQMRDPTDPPTIRTHESRGQGMMLRGIDPLCAARPAWEQETPKGKTMGGQSMGGTMGAM